MAISLSDIQAFRDRLVQARMNGLSSVYDSDGSRIQYKSDSEMAKAIAAADAMLAAANPPIKTIRLVTSKGL